MRLALKGLPGCESHNRDQETIFAVRTALVRTHSVGQITQGKPRVNPGLSYLGPSGHSFRRFKRPLSPYKALSVANESLDAHLDLCEEILPCQKTPRFYAFPPASPFHLGLSQLVALHSS